MQLPSLSLVTPVLNGQQFIGQTLRSVLEQNYPRLDYIVADGGSSDDTLELVREQAPNAKLLSGPDEGLYDALNKGFAATSGEVMGYLNADDLLMPWALSVIGEIFAVFPEIEWLTTLHPMAVDAHGRVVRCRSRTGYSAALFQKGAYFPTVTRPGAFWIQQESTFWRRSLWERAGGGFDPTYRLAGDFDLWRRLFSLTKLYGVDTPLGAFRRHPGQLTDRSLDRYFSEVEIIFGKSGARPPGRFHWLFNRLTRRLSSSNDGPVVRYDFSRPGWCVA